MYSSVINILLSSRCRGGCRLRIISSVVPYSIKLSKPRRTHEEINSCQTVIDGIDDKRVSHPDESGCSKGDVLVDAEFVCWSSEVFETSSDKTPLHDGSPEEDRFWSRRMVHESLEL